MTINDKILHFVIAFILGILSIAFKKISHLRWLVWFSIVMFFGKEIYDIFKANPTGFNYLDLFFDFLGLFFGMFVLNYIQRGK